MDIIEIVGWAAFFYIMWQLLKSWIFVQNLRRRINEALDEQEAVAAIEKQILALRFEHVEENGHQVVLAYGKDNQFLGQGLTESETETKLQKQYPTHRLVVVNETAIIQRILDPLDPKSI